MTPQKKSVIQGGYKGWYRGIKILSSALMMLHDLRIELMRFIMENRNIFSKTVKQGFSRITEGNKTRPNQTCTKS